MITGENHPDHVGLYGEVEAAFDRKEFQLRMAGHWHILVWLTELAEKLFRESGRISARLPNKETDPELYELVMKYQIHKCRLGRCK